jgi:hypothetical protein
VFVVLNDVRMFAFFNILIKILVYFPKYIKVAHFSFLFVSFCSMWFGLRFFFFGVYTLDSYCYVGLFLYVAIRGSYLYL